MGLRTVLRTYIGNSEFLRKTQTLKQNRNKVVNYYIEITSQFIITMSNWFNFSMSIKKAINFYWVILHSRYNPANILLVQSQQ